ncbi:MAG: glycosyltransferase family 2 protein [Calditerrivibrio sp.]|nr:glycosyltransferase family 2 protein [Calditerrivibrio sp.]
MNLDYPKVSLIIPCRNEENHIEKFLSSLCRLNYPKEKLEILFVDGMSTDKTKEIIATFRNKLHISITDNPKRITPVALNLGIKNTSGDYIIIMSSHTEVQEDFIKKNIETIIKEKADCVGGVIITVPPTDDLFSKSISFVLSNKFGVGNSAFRTGVDKTIESDTVPYGCYRRSVFDKYGYFNENLVRNQDIELNLRIKKGGGKIVLNPDIKTIYYSRKDLNGLFIQNFWNGFWVFYSLKFAKLPFSLRHTVPAIFVLSLIVSGVLSFIPFFFYIFIFTISSYTFANIYFSFKIAKDKGFKYFLPTFVSFFTLHFSYGLGSVFGIIKYFLR